MPVVDAIVDCYGKRMMVKIQEKGLLGLPRLAVAPSLAFGCNGFSLAVGCICPQQCFLPVFVEEGLFLVVVSTQRYTRGGNSSIVLASVMLAVPPGSVVTGQNNLVEKWNEKS